MKNLILIVLIFVVQLSSFAQQFRLQISGISEKETKIIDSCRYNSKHLNLTNIAKEINEISGKLHLLGYLENQIVENFKKNDSLVLVKFNLGFNISLLHLYIGPKIRNQNRTNSKQVYLGNDHLLLKEILKLKLASDTLILPYSKTEIFLTETIKKLEQNGYAFAKLKLDHISRKGNVLQANLLFESGNQTQLKEVIVQFEPNDKFTFPKSHLIQINKKYRNNVLNQDLVRKIKNDFDKFDFISQIKPPELLFTKDATKVFVYIEKRKSNNFDGVIGFANNKNNKLVFNGYLDLSLKNTVSAGEDFSLYWKSDGNNQRTLKTSIDLPYLFKSPIGFKAQLYIFKQDSIFQNTKTSIDIGYLLDYKTRVYIGYQATESSDIQNTNSSTISDFTNSFLTSSFRYNLLDNTNAIFSEKTNLVVEIGFGQRSTTNQNQNNGKSKQAFINFSAMHNFYISTKNCFNINYHNYFLKSDAYIVNELYRFGGTKSIRGFTENSFQATFMSAIITEYRYIVSPELYFHTILDYGYYQDKSMFNSGNLIGIGAGVGLATKNGVLRLNFANGSNNGQKTTFSGTIASINYSIQF